MRLLIAVGAVSIQLGGPGPAIAAATADRVLANVETVDQCAVAEHGLLQCE